MLLIIVSVSSGRIYFQVKYIFLALAALDSEFALEHVTPALPRCGCLSSAERYFNSSWIPPMIGPFVATATDSGACSLKVHPRGEF